MIPIAQPAALAAVLDQPARARVAQRHNPPASRAKARARRRVVQLIFVIYLLAILEGALRKWVAPQLSQYLYFVRDPFVICAYFVATNHGLWPRRSLALRIGLIAAAIGGLIALLQVVNSGFDSTQLLFAAYGWRNYFLYLPLALLIGEVFTRRDLVWLCRLTFWLAVPIAILVALQFAASPDSPINVGTATDAASQFRGLGLDGDHTRPMGTFTSVNGQTMFLSSAFALLLALMIMPGKRRPVGRVTIAVGALAVLSAMAFGGSRYTLLHCGLTTIGAMLFGLLARGTATKVRALLLPLTFAIVAAGLYPIIFPEGYSAIAARWTSAAEVESTQYGSSGIFGRALHTTVDFVGLLHVVPALGYGLGFGGNASTTLGATIDGTTPLELAESDWARHIIDLGPLFGSAFIACRIAFVLWLGTLVLRNTRRDADPVPFLLFAFVSIELFYGQVTGQGTINIYAWLFAGFCLSSMRHDQRRYRTRTASAALRAPVETNRIARQVPQSSTL